MGSIGGKCTPGVNIFGLRNKMMWPRSVFFKYKHDPVAAGGRSRSMVPTGQPGASAASRGAPASALSRNPSKLLGALAIMEALEGCL